MRVLVYLLVCGIRMNEQDRGFEMTREADVSRRDQGVSGSENFVVIVVILGAGKASCKDWHQGIHIMSC